jgi:SAM-dependent methyltransferase
MNVHRCLVCHSYDSELLYPGTLPARAENSLLRFRSTSNSYGLHTDILRCLHCGLVFATPSYSDQDLIRLYTEVVDPRYVAEREGRFLTFRRNIRAIGRLVGSRRGRLLDVGCHIGVFVEIAQKEGWDAWGVEPSRWAAGYAQGRGLQVLATTVADAGFADGSFDIVTMWDVIEHLADPAAELRTIHRILRPSGLLVIHTMNVESLVARLMGSRWPWLMEMHRFFFSPRTLNLMLGQVGFRQFEVKRQGRYLRLEYAVSRLAPYLPRVSKYMLRTTRALHLGSLPVPINLGDLFTSFSKRMSDLPLEIL